MYIMLGQAQLLQVQAKKKKGKPLLIYFLRFLTI